MNWTKVNDHVIRSKCGRWQIAQYQDVPHKCYELWDIDDVNFNDRNRKYGTLITTDRDPNALRAIAKERDRAGK